LPWRRLHSACAALAWNSAITALVKQILGRRSDRLAVYLCGFVTVLAVMVMVNLASSRAHRAA